MSERSAKTHSNGWRRATRPVVTVCDWTTAGGALIAALGLVSMMVLIVANVILRRFGHPIDLTEQLASYFFEATSFAAVAYAIRHAVMARVPLLLVRLRMSVRFWAILVIYCASLAAVIALIVSLVQDVISSYDLGTVSNASLAVPDWTIDIVPVVGFCLIGLQLVAGTLYLLDHHVDRSGPADDREAAEATLF